MAHSRFSWRPVLGFALAVLLSGMLSASCEDMIRLSIGWVRTDAVSLTAVLESEDLPLLDRFPLLRQLDLSGSSGYSALSSWAQTHPEKELRYTVTLPDGSVVDNSVTQLDLSGLDPALAEDALPLLACLPALESVDLGDAAGGLTPEQVLAFLSAYPRLRFDYRFRLFGRELSLDTETLDLSGRGHADAPELLRYLPVMRKLRSVDLGSDENLGHFVWEDITAMEAARPETEFQYAFTLFGKAFSLTDRTMDLNHIPMDDRGEAVRQAAQCMPKLRRLEMDSCGISNRDMLALRDALPRVKVVWRVWIADHYSVRTDTKRLLASMPGQGGNVDDDDAEALSCCTDVRYLDLGHNVVISDISFVSSMPELRVAVLAMNDWSDASPLANCPHLEYLELQTTSLSDLTPLAGLKELKHLNICYLYDLPQLERLWIGCLDPVPESQIAHMQKLAPDCEINTTTYDPTMGGWRFDENGDFVPRYALLRRQFGNYALESYAFSWNDPLLY